MTEVNKVSKCWYATSEALEYIIAPGSDSELSDLEKDSDDDNDFTVEKILLMPRAKVSQIPPTQKRVKKN